MPETASLRLVSGQADGRAGSNTVAIEVNTSTSAAKSCQRGVSPRNTMPLNTPTTGMISEPSEDTAAGTICTSLFHAQYQNSKPMKTLYQKPNMGQKLTRLHSTVSSACPASAIGIPPSKACQAVSAVMGMGSGFRL